MRPLSGNKIEKAGKSLKIKENPGFIFDFGTKMELETILQFIGNFIPLTWKQMGVGVQRCFHLLMTETIRNDQWRESQFDQQACMRMPEIV